MCCFVKFTFCVWAFFFLSLINLRGFLVAILLLLLTFLKGHKTGCWSQPKVCLRTTGHGRVEWGT